MSTTSRTRTTGYHNLTSTRDAMAGRTGPVRPARCGEITYACSVLAKPVPLARDLGGVRLRERAGLSLSATVAAGLGEPGWKRADTAAGTLVAVNLELLVHEPLTLFVFRFGAGVGFGGGSSTGGGGALSLPSGDDDRDRGGEARVRKYSLSYPPDSFLTVRFIVTDARLEVSF